MFRNATRTVASLAASAALIALLSACSTTEGAGTGTGEGEAPSDTTTIVTVPKLTGNTWFQRMEAGLKEYAEDTGANAYMQGSGQSDSAAQNQVIEDLIAQKVSALSVIPYQPDATESVLKKARENGIVVITHEAPGFENNDWDVEAFANEDYGRMLMDELAERMGGSGQYATMVGSLTSDTHRVWVESAIAYQQEKYPNMEHVGDTLESTNDPQVAYERTKELLAKYPDLKGFQGSASDDVVGAGQAVEELGLDEQVSVVGTSTPQYAYDGLSTGAIDMIAFWDPADAGYVMNVVAQMVLDGKTPEPGMDLGRPGYESVKIDGKVISGDAWVTVTGENVDDYDF